MKPGYRTTEFWTTAATQMLALLAVVGVLSAGDAASLGSEISKGITAATVVAASAWNVLGYVRSRTALKGATEANRQEAGPTP